MKQKRRPRHRHQRHDEKTQEANHLTASKVVNLSPHTVQDVLTLQQAVGNQAVQRLAMENQHPLTSVQRENEGMLASININHPVNYVAQETETSCWSAAVSMLLGGEMTAGPGEAELNADGTMPPQSLPELAESYGLSLEGPQSWTVEGLTGLLESGPIIMLGQLGATDAAGNPQPHAIVIGGIAGEGQPENTHLTIYDPDMPDDAPYTLAVSDLYNMYPEASDYIMHV